MANPFSAVPTPFRVHAGRPLVVRELRAGTRSGSARRSAPTGGSRRRCPDCDEPITVEVRDGHPDDETPALPLPRARRALVGRHRLHLRRDEPLPVGGARRALARRACSPARRSPSRQLASSPTPGGATGSSPDWRPHTREQNQAILDRLGLDRRLLAPPVAESPTPALRRCYGGGPRPSRMRRRHASPARSVRRCGETERCSVDQSDRDPRRRHRRHADGQPPAQAPRRATTSRSPSSTRTTATSTSRACCSSRSASPSADDIVRPRRPPAARRASRSTQTEIDHVEPDGRRWCTSTTAPTLPYDVLVVATGTRLLPEETEGLTGPGWKEKRLHLLRRRRAPRRWPRRSRASTAAGSW